MPFPKHSHDNPNYVHTADDMMFHEMESFVQGLYQKSVYEFLGTTFGELNHCDKCKAVENTRTRQLLVKINKSMKKMDKEFLSVAECMEERVRLLFPKIMVNHPELVEQAPSPLHEAQDESSASPADPDTSSTE